jgi:hypothetical protein
VVRLYVDEDVSVLLATLLRHRNVDATTARDWKMLHKEDIEHLEFASSMNAAIVAHNREHFEELFTSFTEQGRAFGGIIIIKQKSSYLLADSLLRFTRERKDTRNQLWYL